MNTNIFCQSVAKKLNRPINIDERTLISNYLSQITIDSHTSLKLAFKYHLEQIIRKLSAKISDVDIKEYQIKAIGLDAEDGYIFTSPISANSRSNSETIIAVAEKKDMASLDTENASLDTENSAKLETIFLLEVGEVYDLSKAIAPKSKHKYNYLMLDSDNCIEISNERDKFTWLIQEEHLRFQSGYINLHSKLRNIVMARLGRMTMAHQTTTFTDEAINRNRFAFGFDEFASQALITPEGTRFQFIEILPEYDVNYGTTVTLSPFNENRGWFRFRERFKILDKLSLTITNLNTSTKFVLPATPISIPGMQTIGGGIVHPFLGPIVNPLVVNRTYLPVDYFYGSVGYEYDLGASVNEYFLMNDLNSGFPAVDATYNGILRQLLYFGFENYFSFVAYVVPAGPLGDFPVTLTLIYKPRFTGVLELISEDDDDSDTEI